MIKQLNITRFIAALLVIIFHAPDNFIALYPFLSGIKGHGKLAVSYFFVLSGFIMSFSYYGRQFTPTQYWLRRFFRIYPLYAFALLLYIGLALRFEAQPPPNILLDSFLCFALIQGFFPAKALALNFPSWSLSVEAFFYLVFPYLFYRLAKQSNTTNAIQTIVVWVLSQIVFITLLSQHLAFSYYNPFLHFNSFMLGAVAGLYFCRQALPTKTPLAVSTVLVACGISSLFFLYLLPFDLNYLHNGLLAPLFLCIIIGLATQKSWFTRFCSHRLFVYLGDISYGMYILQIPCVRLTYYILEKLHIKADNYFFLYHLFLIIIVSVLAYEWVEKPIRNYYKKYA
jgi:peptidoglycan/LPS O-acetylase OafA/YrhL